jgi:RsiW-degrading membrane proteinase PrsW (M82 family)
MILRIFFWGMLITVPAIFIQLGFFELALPPLFVIFIGVALVEEFLKYFVVRLKVMPSPELDEPLDVMLYMIIAALGFAAFENILKFLSPDVFDLGLADTLIMTGFLFISSTLLHALASGMFGYFLALSFLESRKKWYFLFAGLSSATLWHGFYNFAIMKIDKDLNFAAVVIVVLVSAAIIVSLGFQRLKKMPSICNI